MKRKCLAVGIILSFIGAAIIPSTAQNIENSSSTSRGHWLYVGGSGPGNYTKIQDALDASADGDTVFVYNGTYKGQLIILHSVRLLGESKNTTIIEAKESDLGDVVRVQDNDITISGFTLQADNGGHNLNDIIRVNPWGDSQTLSNITISENIFSVTNLAIAINGYFLIHCAILHNTFHLQNATGVYLLSGSKYVVADNIFTLNGSTGITFVLTQNSSVSNNTMIAINNGNIGSGGIIISSGDSCAITDNFIQNMQAGIQIEYSYGDMISNNILVDNYVALFLPRCSDLIITYNKINNTKAALLSLNTLIGIDVNGEDNLISNNLIRHCQFGLFMTDCSNTVVSKNTFEDNIIHARFDGDYGSKWNQNYWGRPRLAPKPIFGIRDPLSFYPGFFEFDWHPAKQPYDI